MMETATKAATTFKIVFENFMTVLRIIGSSLRFVIIGSSVFRKLQWNNESIQRGIRNFGFRIRGQAARMWAQRLSSRATVRANSAGGVGVRFREI
jgi:hypothetical protein